MNTLKFFLLLPCLWLPVFQEYAAARVLPKNSVGINTIQVINNHIGFGAYYERSLDANDRLSVIIPVSVAWEMRSADFIYTDTTDRGSNSSLFFNPGIKFYPTGNKNFFSYAIGVSIFSHIGAAERIYGSKAPDLPYLQTQTYRFSSAGVLLNNYINFKINRNISFGFEVGIGPTYFNNYKQKGTNTVVKGGITTIPNIAFQCAYRF
ncbi:MAG: hypothetical protein EOP54_00335 [Sphingobacteriales bacterium]|nr:MAG: hypothetical protein EOP54_00335 [Sphingobacteriales bacterium]